MTERHPQRSAIHPRPEGRGTLTAVRAAHSRWRWFDTSDEGDTTDRRGPFLSEIAAIMDAAEDTATINDLIGADRLAQRMRAAARMLERSR